MVSEFLLRRSAFASFGSRCSLARCVLAYSYPSLGTLGRTLGTWDCRICRQSLASKLSFAWLPWRWLRWLRRPSNLAAFPRSFRPTQWKQSLLPVPISRPSRLLLAACFVPRTSNTFPNKWLEPIASARAAATFAFVPPPYQPDLHPNCQKPSGKRCTIFSRWQCVV